jgi:hypothetical protein
MHKKKSGLQKNISSIFGEAPIAKETSAIQIPIEHHLHSSESDSGDNLPDDKVNSEQIAATNVALEEETPAPTEPAVDTAEAAAPTEPAVDTAEAPAPTEPVVDMVEAPAPLSEEPEAPAGQREPQVVAAEPQETSRPWQELLQKAKGKLFKPKPGVSSSRQKTMVIIVPLLLIIFVFNFGRLLIAPSQKTKKNSTVTQTDPRAKSENEIKWTVPKPYPQQMRDPMKPALAMKSQSSSGELTVKGIVFSDNPSAVIDGQIVREGDVIIGATVLKINEASVEFEKDNKRWKQTVQR